MNADFKLGIIGAGNMSGAIARGIVSAGALKTSDVFVSDLDENKLELLKQIGIRTSTNNQDVVDHSDLIIMAVKPNIYDIVVPEIKNTNGKIFVSIAPGLTIHYIKNLFKEPDIKLVRAMPNTPLMVGCGMTALSYESPVTEADFQKVSIIFNSLGKSVCMDESMMNSVVSMNGSSPAYVFMFIDAMIQKGQEYGFDYESAKTLVAQTVLGAAKMVMENDTPVDTLKVNVCSPGGTTIEAVHVLEKAGLYQMMKDAMDACTQKTIKLAKN